MAGMTDRTFAAKLMDGSLHAVAYPTVTAPLKLKLLTTTGSNTANGTEATGTNNPGYTAGGYAITFGANASGISASSNSQTYTASGTQTANITGAEVWDSSGTPQRILQGALSSAITGVVSGDTVTFATGAITADASQW